MRYPCPKQRQPARQDPESVSLPQEVGGKEAGMPLYMSQFAYTLEAWATLARSAEARSAAVGL